MDARTYVVGVPLVITVDENGRVTFDVDLSEVTDFTEHIEDDLLIPDEIVDADVLTVAAAADTLGNHFTLPVITPNPTA